MALTFGMEEEYLLIDEDSGELTPRAPEVLKAGSDMGISISAELNRCQVEVATGVCEALGQAERELEELRTAARRAGAPSRSRPSALGSHPFSSWQDQEINTDDSRYATLEQTYQQLARQQAICGFHVHVGVDDPDVRIGVMDRVRSWLPVLLALSANSPYWEGVDTGYASYRTIIWKPWPTAAMPPRLRSFQAYETLVSELQAIESIESPKSLYWYVRPSSQFETLEFRVADVCLKVSDAVTIAGLTRALVTVAAAEIENGRQVADQAPNLILESAVWRAARYGLDHTLVDPTARRLHPAEEVVQRLLDYVTPGLEAAGDRPRVLSGVQDILRRGNGASMQRAALTRTANPRDAMAFIASLES